MDPQPPPLVSASCAKQAKALSALVVSVTAPDNALTSLDARD